MPSNIDECGFLKAPSDWQVRRLGTFATKVGSGATPRGGKSVYLGSRQSHALIRSQHVFDRWFDGDDIAFISEQHSHELRSAEVRRGDILLNITGDGVTFARACIVPEDVLPACVNQHVSIIRLDHSVCVPGYLLAFLTHPLTKRYIESFNTGGSRRAITKGHIESFEVPLPPLPIQQRIASILSAYDDLIENNARRIKLLEEMAQMLYREWFVHFRFPGHEKVRMVESELGPIPEGWLRPYSDFVDFLEGPGLRKWQYRDAGLPFLNIRTILDNDIDLGKTQFLDPHEVNAKYKHFLLAEWDHVVSSSGTLGRIATVRRQHLPVMLNTSIIRMRPKTPSVGRWQLKHFLKGDYFQHQIRSFAIGAAQPNFGPSHLKQAKIVAPTEELGRTYEGTVEPLELLVHSLIQTNTNLRTTRDLLLPKLISGEIPVEAAEDGAAAIEEEIALHA